MQNRVFAEGLQEPLLAQCEDSIVSPERHAESVWVSPGPDAQQEHRQGVGKALYFPFLANCGRC